MSVMQSYRTFVVQGTPIELELPERVFAPSAHGQYFAENLQFHAHESVLDVGTGAGILAIYAALQGARVAATDIVPEAVVATRANGQRNGVDIDARQGEFFADFNQRFDVIMANLPQEIVPPKDIEAMGPAAAAIAGGLRGNDLLIEFLRLAPRYMYTDSRLYLPLHTLSDYQHTLTFALKNFNVRLVNIGDLPVKPFVTNNLEFYKALNEQGVIRIVSPDNRSWFSHVYVIELTLH